MAHARLVAVVLCAACGASSSTESDAGTELPPDAGPSPCEPVDSCQIEFRYPRTAGISSAELRGDFVADGWDTGVSMSPSGGYFTASLELADRQVVQYKFVINGSQWEIDPDNPSQLADEAGIVNSILRVDCGCSGRYDWRDSLMYFVVLDRFADGDGANNSPVADVPTAANYQGGDLAGLKSVIEEGYFEALGVDVLWITSPVDNADSAELGADGNSYSAYHGYWPRDLEEVEARAGDLAALTAVVEAAHERGMRVVLDYVMNHVHISSPLYAEHNDWFWPNDNGAGGPCVCGYGCDWEGEQGRRCWFRDYLPDFNFTHPDARSWSVDNAVRWITRTGVDGYRLDAVKHIETRWIHELRRRLQEEIEPASGETFYLVGETFSGDQNLIGSYVDPVTLLDGQFDFPLRAQIVTTILGRQGSMNELALFMSENDGAYHPGAVMSTFIGNHDLPRSIHLAEDEPLFDPWDGGQWRAWDDPPPLPTSAAPFERLGVAFGLLLTSPGIPLIYYGDEIGMAGAGDPDNRRMMQWTGRTHNQERLFELVARLGQLRRQHRALRRGTRSILRAVGEVLVYEMADADEVLAVALNRGDADETAAGLADRDYTDLITGEELSAPVPLLPRSVRILAPR